MSHKSLNDCGSPVQQTPQRLDGPAPSCAIDNIKLENPREATENIFYKGVPNIEDPFRRRDGLGQANQCDPMQTGQLVAGNGPPGEVIYRYAQGLRAVDDAVKDLFTNVVVQDDLGKVHPVPIIWGGQEAAVTYVLQANVRKDNSMVVDRISLPIMSIRSTSPTYAEDRYIYHRAIDYKRRQSDGKPGFTVKERTERDTILGFARGIPLDIPFELLVWTMYTEDMKQILEQIIQKFSKVAYIRLQGVTNWENFVKLDSMSSNEDLEPGENKRIIKYQIGLTAVTYIPQPIYRKKAVLTTKIDVVDGITEEEITQVIARLEQTVENL